MKDENINKLVSSYISINKQAAQYTPRKLRKERKLKTISFDLSTSFVSPSICLCRPVCNGVKRINIAWLLQTIHGRTTLLQFHVQNDFNWSVPSTITLISLRHKWAQRLINCVMLKKLELKSNYGGNSNSVWTGIGVGS